MINGEGMSQNTVDIYLLHSGSVTWSHRGSSSPFAWTDAGRVVHHHEIYMGGGKITHGYICSSGSGPCMNSHYFRKSARYNPIDDSWQVLPSMRYGGMSRAGFFVHGERLYSVYAQHHTEFMDLIREWKGWTEQQVNLSSRVEGTKSVVKIGANVYITGNSTSWGSYSTVVMSWNPDTEESWKPVANMSIPRNQIR